MSGGFKALHRPLIVLVLVVVLVLEKGLGDPNVVQPLDNEKPSAAEDPRQSLGLSVRSPRRLSVV